MRKFLLILALAVCSCGTATIDVDKIVSLSGEQCRIMETFLSEDSFPRSFENGKFVSSEAWWWCSGFYPGVCWYTYLLGKDPEIRDLALRQTAKLQDVSKLCRDHDLGFQVMCSSGFAYKETGDSLYLKTIREAAAKLAARYSPVTGVIKSWNGNDGLYRVIIDNMMNLELLTYASRMFDVPEWKDIALSHARNTLKNHFRPNASSYHVVIYDEENGGVLKRITAQGYADESAWARGQAWGLYGFTMMYRETGEQEFLDQANRIAAFLLPLLEKQPVPAWDFNAPAPLNEQVDASAGAIMASAFLELCQYAPNARLGAKYKKTGIRILEALSGDEYLCKPGECAGFLLKHSTGNLPKNSEVDVPLTYADYYFMEALYKYSQL
ncbi:MAG: glycoside hydrolase family 88 protein [Bacteroidales bacterium]|nr:glycoside hydrolase family 88 protein [Bacteroidales bacterium]